jgi:hypothetical protein
MVWTMRMKRSARMGREFYSPVLVCEGLLTAITLEI